MPDHLSELVAIGEFGCQLADPRVGVNVVVVRIVPDAVACIRSGTVRCARLRADAIVPPGAHVVRARSEAHPKRLTNLLADCAGAMPVDVADGNVTVPNDRPHLFELVALLLGQILHPNEAHRDVGLRTWTGLRDQKDAEVVTVVAADLVGEHCVVLLDVLREALRKTLVCLL